MPGEQVTAILRFGHKTIKNYARNRIKNAIKDFRVWRITEWEEH